MSIRGKLIALIVGMVLIFLLAMGIFIISRVPLQKINEEKERLDHLRLEILNIRTEINKLDSGHIEEQWKTVLDAKDRLNSTFDEMANLTMLPGLNPKIDKAVGIIIRLQELFQAKYVEMESMIEDLIFAAEDVFIFSGGIKPMDFYTNYRADDHPDIAKYRLLVQNFLSAIYVADMNLESSVDVIGEQYAVIDRQIATIERQNLLTITVLLIVLVGAVLLIALFIANGIGKNIASIEASIDQLTGGDLTVRITASSKDDIGRLADNLNRFIGVLSGSVENIKITSSQNITVKEELVVTTNQTTASVQEMGAGAASIKEQISKLDQELKKSGREMETVSGRINGLMDSLNEQMAMVEESTSSVTEMIASIGNVAEITEKRRSATDKLVQTARSGGKQLETTASIIQEINGRIGEIRGTTDIIQNVAAQTNLLAMNAAIEAAHAGEYGRGFAVVAEEIRKLAEASSKSSKQIAKVIKEMISRIQEAAESGVTTKKAFNEIDSEVQEVAGSFQEINASMAELQTGGKQILEAMTTLNDVSIQVRDGGNEMSESNRSVLGAMEQVDRISTEVMGSISEITAGLEEINKAMLTVNDLTDKVSGISNALDEAVQYFRTDEAAETADLADVDGEQPFQELEELEELESDTSEEPGEGADGNPAP
jgi:methyl-accepting chemotaxis protein